MHQYNVLSTVASGALIKNMSVMYAGRVACCPLVSDVKHAPCAQLRLEENTEQTDGQTEGRTPDCYITLTARCDQRKKGWGL